MGFQESFQSRVIPAAERAFGVLATLTHGEWLTEEFTALLENEQFEAIDREGFGTQFHSRVIMFDVVSASFMGTPFEPVAGDRIALTEHSTAKVFEINTQPGVPAVELMPGGQRWRVRVKRVQ
jgi:hypothetical protein